MTLAGCARWQLEVWAGPMSISSSSSITLRRKTLSWRSGLRFLPPRLPSLRRGRAQCGQLMPAEQPAHPRSLNLCQARRLAPAGLWQVDWLV